MIEFPEEPRASSSSSSPGAGRAADPATEAELWLRRELAFLHRVERRILRRAHWRREAWRVVAVGSMLAVFALCWYLAAIATGGSAQGSCAGKVSTSATAGSGSAATGASGQGSTARQSGTTSTTKTASGTAASCGSSSRS